MSTSSLPVPTRAADRRAAIVLRLLVAAGAATAAFAIGCASGMLPETMLTPGIERRWPGTTNEELSKGRSLYRDQCSGCHSLYTPANFSTAQWDTLLPVMQRKARTSAADRMIMAKYVMIHAKQPAIDP